MKGHTLLQFERDSRLGYAVAYVTQTYFQKGFGLKAEVGPVLERTYQSDAVERLKALGYDASAGGIRLKLAREFGFCYGVDRAVDYAYQARRRFPDRDVYLTGEIFAPRRADRPYSV